MTDASPKPAWAGPRNRARDDLRTIRTLLPYLWPKGKIGLRSRVGLALGLLVGAKTASVTVPLLYKQAVDVLTAEAGIALVLPLGLLLAYGLVRASVHIFGELRDAVFAKVVQSAICSVALKIFQHLHALALRFHLDRQTGGLTRAIERGTKGIEFLLTFVLFNVLPTLIEILLICGILWVLYDFWFSLVTFAALASYIAFTLFVTEWRIKYRRRMNEMDSEANTKAIDSLLNFETVKYFGNEAHEAKRYDRALKAYERAAVRAKTSLSALNIGQGAIIAVGLISVMIMAGRGVVGGSMTIGDFVLVHLYMIQLFMPLGFLGFVYHEIKQSLADMESMFELFEVKADIRDEPDAHPLEVRDGVVEFDGVSFAYDPRNTILDDVSFTVPSGQTLAIVGPSGSGKSTIARLLFRFYDADRGTIRIDKQEIHEVTQDSLRAAIGIVPQDTVLFNDTIYYNIAYGRLDATPAEVERAARLAKIHDFIMSRPDGYQARVGERGLKLSGGEKQRVAIARTILKDPRILLFDEATSALDSKTEKEIQTSLAEVSRDRTTLVIAHRLSTVVDADEILVLKAGRVVERGRHADLLSRAGEYAAMWQRQQEAGEEAEGESPAPDEKLAETDALSPEEKLPAS